MANIIDSVTGPNKDTSGFGQSKYDFTQRIFPSDLGSDNSYNNHWLVINIAVQNDSLLGQSEKYYDILDNDYSKTDLLRFNSGFTGSAAGNPTPTSIATRPRFTKRIAESIALYMPNSEVTYSDNHDFQNISLTKFAAGVATGVAQFGAGVLGGVDAVNTVGQISNGLQQIIGNVAGTLFNRPINPRVELLYSNTFQREFTFDFLFAPSSEEESKALEQIIRTLRFHAAPEARGGGGDFSQSSLTDITNLNPFAGGIDAFVGGVVNTLDSFFWVPPSEFDITFYHNGAENTKIPRINTCVLKSIDTSYAPAGTYSTFSNGYPVQTRMVLRFQEVEVTHKQRVLQGF